MNETHQAVLFDLDGTLLDTLDDLARSGNDVLEARGLPTHSRDAYRHFIGCGMANLVRVIFPEEERPAEGAETEAILREYRAAYARNWNRTTVPFPGIPELLDELCARGIPIGVLSNKSHDFTVKCIEEFLPGWAWTVVFGHREGKPRKPDPASAHEAAGILGVDPNRCFYIGDSDVDMQTAKNSGMRAIGVEWGFRPVSELQEHGADAILSEPADLLALLDSAAP